MSRSRREFLAETSLGLLAATTPLAAAAPCLSQEQQPGLPPGAPPAFGTAHPMGPIVSPTTFAEAEKLVQVELNDAERGVAAASWRVNMAPLVERRTGPRKVALEPGLAPYSRWDPVLPGQRVLPARDRFIRSDADPGPLPANDEDIAFASVTQLSRWIEHRKLSSERLTHLYLDRLEKFNPELRCVITLTRELALAQAKKADEEIAAGKYRGPLHGVPWGGKDLLDTAGIPTTYGAEPYRNRVPTKDAAVVQRLHEAGAVLVAKLSLGSLALNDIWFGGQTMNPWLLEEGLSLIHISFLRAIGIFGKTRLVVCGARTRCAVSPHECSLPPDVDRAGRDDHCSLAVFLPSGRLRGKTRRPKTVQACAHGLSLIHI